MEALNRHYYKCGPCRLSPAQEQELIHTITTKLPSKAGFENLANWTLALVVEYTREKWGVDYSHKEMFLILERRGLPHTWPTYIMANADSKKQPQFQEETSPEV